jgi:hypothetical protein
MGMYSILDVNEGTTVILNAAFEDEDGDPVIPEAVSYAIYDVSSETYVLAKTTIAVGLLDDEIDIEITAAQNAIIDNTKKYELRIVSVDFTYSTSKHGTNEYQFRIKNLVSIPLA